jgi:hypothetical protein
MKRWLPLLLAVTTPIAAQTAPQSSTVGPALTIYNQDFAVIRDHIPLELKTGVNNVHFSGVTAQLEPASVMLRDCSGKRTPHILEQNFRPSVSQRQMLAMSEGQTLEFQVGGNQTVQGKIIHAAGGYQGSYYGQAQPYPGNEEPLIEVNGKLQFSLPGMPLFPVPADQSYLHPQINWLLESDSAGSTSCELSYVSGGMNWEADYNVIAPVNGDALDLIGWVTLADHSGKTFENARIKLMAGDVNKVQQRGMGGSAGGAVIHAAAVAPTGEVTEKAFDEYHLYTLERPTTLSDGETKQVEFVHKSRVPSKRVYVYTGFSWSPAQGQQFQPEYFRQQREFGTTSQSKVWVMREIVNSEQNGLGMALPKGRMRFYRQDEGGQLEFIGENTIDHTPRGETLRIYTGNAFDLSGDRRRTNFKIENGQMWADETFEITVKNHRKEAVDVVIVEHLYRSANWEISSKSASFTKRDSNTIEFPVNIPADGAQTVIYTAHYTW